MSKCDLYDADSSSVCSKGRGEWKGESQAGIVRRGFHRGGPKLYLEEHVGL